MSMLQKIYKFLNSLDTRVWVVAATVIAFALGTYRLGARCLWFDEAYSVFYIKKDWAGFWEIIINFEANQVLYYVLLKFWMLLGDDEVTLRFLSVIFATAAVPMIYAVGNELFDKKVGLVAAFLLAVNGELLYYAQEVRGYSFLLLLTICSSYIAIRCVKYPSLKMWASYVLVNVLATYVHFFAIWIMLVHAVLLLFLPRKEINWKSVIASAGFITALLSPLIVFVLKKDIGQISWVHTPNLDSLLLLLNFLTGINHTNYGEPSAAVIFSRAAYLFLCAIPVIYLIHSCIRNKQSKNTWRYAFIVFWLFLPIILVYWVSMLKPIFHPRYLIIVLPGFILSAAFALTRLKIKWMSVTASALLIITGISISLDSYEEIKKPNWRGIAEHINESSLSKDSILFIHGGSIVPFDYYWNKINIPPKNILYGNPSGPYSRLKNPNPPKLDSQWIENLSNRHQRIWFVILWAWGKPRLKKFQGWMEKYYVRKQYRNFGQNLQLELYVNKN
jgi:mannosyltransferase